MGKVESLSSAEQQAWIKVWKDAFDLESLNLTKSLTGGISGAEVLLVEYQPHGQRRMMGVLKVTHKQGDYDREVHGHTQAKQSWLDEIVPGVPLHAAMPEGFGMLSPMALPGGVLRASPTLQMLVDKGDGATAGQVTQALGEFYGRHILGPGTETRYGSAFKIVEQVFQPWAAKLTGIDWKWLGLPGIEDEVYLDERRLRLNPLWCLYHAAPWKQDQISLAWGFQHRDLNARNIIVASRPSADREAPGILRLIDFEKSGETSMLMDACWLSLLLVLSSAHGRVSLASEDWQRLPGDLVNLIVGEEAHGPSAGAFQFGFRTRRPLPRPDSPSASISGRRMHWPRHAGHHSGSRGIRQFVLRSPRLAAGAATSHGGPSVPTVCAKRSVFSVWRLALEKCIELLETRTTSGDLTSADLTGLRADQQKTVEDVFDDKLGIETIDRIAKLEGGGHGLAKLAAVRVRQVLRDDPTQLENFVDHLAAPIRRRNGEHGRGVGPAAARRIGKQSCGGATGPFQAIPGLRFPPAFLQPLGELAR